MPQAVSKTITIQRAHNSNVTAKALIEAHRRALDRRNAADKAVAAIDRPELVRLLIPEIGPSCAAYSFEGLDALQNEHIERQGLIGLARLEFLQRMSGYRTVLAQLEGLDTQWRKRVNLDELEAESGSAHDEAERAWKSLLARVKSHPRDIPEIARYLASEEAERGDIWRMRALLRAIAAVRLAVRK